MAARHDDRAGGGEHTPDAAADRDLGAGDLSGGGTAHLAHAPPAIHPGMHVREAAAIRYGLKNLGFAPRGEAGRLITNGMSRSAMRFPLAARDVVWNRCELSRSARDLAKVGNPPISAVRRSCRGSSLAPLAGDTRPECGHLRRHYLRDGYTCFHWFAARARCKIAPTVFLLSPTWRPINR